MSLVSPCSPPGCAFPRGRGAVLCENHKAIAKAADEVMASKPRHKFRAVRTDVNGRSYPSKLEASYAALLHARREAGEIIGWLEHVPLRLAGGVTYQLDFLIFEADGSVRAVETKGFETPVWRVKQKLVAEAYPWLPVEVVKAVKRPRAKKESAG